ncbi:MAG: DoxX family protein [Gemmatimonadales bacterium]|nr:DoxX family protein [Gemmatimonadales bacterium]
MALALFFVAAGTLHFVVPTYYRTIVPWYLPSPATLVAVSGAAEIAGGLGLLVPRLRQAAGAGLLLLLIVLLPANIEMLQLYRGRGGPWWGELLLWLRLPFQGILAWWVWRLSRQDPEERPLAARFPR